MKQISFAQAEHQNKKKVTRRERFLALPTLGMDDDIGLLLPWRWKDTLPA